MEEASFRYVGEAIEQSNVRLGVLMQAPELTLAGLDRKLFSGAAKAGARFVKFLRKLLQKRLQQEPADGIKDIFSFLQQCKDAQTGEGLGAMEISTETATFIVAGSDTTSTTMASLAHYLVWSPRCYKRAVEEVRARFSCADEITFGAKLNSCVFLRACLDEALRITPPGGGPLWREMERGGARIDGEYLPAGCEVGAGIYAMHRSPRNWPNPDSYTPERWLDKETKSAGQPYFPFNIGPRSCVGKPLALAQIMLTFARILWEFDLCRADVGKSWLESSDAEPPEYMLQDHVTGHKEGPTVVHNVLSKLYSGTLSQGKQISGPKWQFPNGQIFDKFVNGRAKSDEWIKKFGNVYRVWGGCSPEIVITTPEDLRIFSSDGEKHGKHSNMGWFLDQLLGRCIGFLQGEEWKQKRQIFYPTFSHDKIAARINLTESAANKFTEDLPFVHSDGYIETGPRKTVSFRVADGFRKFPLDVTASIIYGTMTNAERDDLWTLAEKRLALWPFTILGGPYRFSWGSWFDRKSYSLLNEYTIEWRNYNDRIVETRRASGIKTPVVLIYDAYEAGDITLENLMHSLDEIILTNLDVMVHAITWAIKNIAENKKVQQELGDEIDANWDRLHEYISKSDTYLHRSFMETLRLQPPAVFNIGETSPSVKTFNGILVEPNTMVLVDVLAINVRNPFWGSDSEEFRPSRFENIKPTDLRYNIAIFGFGSRKCPGQYIAAQGIKALLAHLLRRYKIDIVTERKEKTERSAEKSEVIPIADVIVQLTSRDFVELY
ncbi:Cytochrome P450 CYP5334A1 [Metarhizium robertsii ARSEF 23]|uniref:Cytochrome P450 CYP5334A1 n=1 Tax=Metarhizium robertsii (strain ARSEF 23 / ATCC MYA-3075) TaxID=655844 RepID=E9FCN6_METRA|nr:Cytochrome P450 CYP5334A1 [Metarhizium robertsii ARSEF 23]EFY94492.2 Cytochrome P450 CYP5334A1 [Metarhizium robertsii ARSEF 23]